MRYEISVTYTTERTPDDGPVPSDMAEPIRRPTPSFFVNASDNEDARSQVSSILNFPANAYVDVKPVVRMSDTEEGRAALTIIVLEALGLAYLAREFVTTAGKARAPHDGNEVQRHERWIAILEGLRDETEAGS